MNYSKGIIPVLSIFVLLSCSKTEEQPNKLVGIWIKKKSEQKSANTPWEDITQPCMLDDMEEYKANGSYYLYPGADWCSASEQTISGTWKLTGGETIVQYTYSGISGTYESTINTLDNNTLVITHATGTGAGDQIRDTYIKK